MSARRSLVFSDGVFDGLVELGRQAEDACFHRVWTTEWASRDAVARAQLVATGTSTIGVGTGIAYAFTRSPVAAAALAADAYLVTGRRFAFGLGVGSRGVRQRYFGVADFDHAVSRLEEYVEILRRAWRSEAGLSFSGRFYEIDAPAFAVGHDPARLVGLEVCAAGVNEVMIRAAARSCDGVLLHAVTRAEPYFSEHVLPAIATGSRTRDTAPWVAMWVVTAVDESEEEARVAARRTLAFYFSTPSYFSTVEASPWAEPVRRLQERFRAESGLPDWDALGRLLPDEMVDELAVAGTPTHVAARIASLEADLGRCGVREIVLQPAVLGLADRDGAAAYASVIAGCEVSSEIPPMEVHDATV